jgi:replicative DNA helicase
MYYPGTIPDKLPPHNVEAEEAVIGALLIDPDVYIRVDNLTPKDFFIERNGWIFRAIQELRGNTDLVVLCDELERRNQLEEIGGPAYLTSLINRTPSSFGAEEYARIVERTSLLRQQIHLAGEVARAAYAADADPEKVNEEAIGKYLEIQSKLKGTKTSMTYREIVERIYDDIDYLRQHPEAMLAISTGYKDVDKKMRGGFKPGFYVLAGATHMGKTLLAQCIVENTAGILKQHNQGSVLVLSLEMSPQQLVQRSLEGEMQLDTGDMDIVQYMATLDDAEPSTSANWATFINASATLTELPIRVVAAAGLTPIQLYNLCRQYQYQERTRLVVVDYLQLMQGGDAKRIDNRTQELGYISRQIKLISGELSLPILALSQLHRGPASRSDHRPMLSDLRESGNIEENADVIFFAYRDNYYNPDTEFPNIFEVIFQKNRIDGVLGPAHLFYSKKENRFKELEVRRQPLEY